MGSLSLFYTSKLILFFLAGATGFWVHCFVLYYNGEWIKLFHSTQRLSKQQHG